MDIHKPKAAHSWREFLIEIGTIICGILIALGLEQGIEWLHHDHELRETREALAHEIARNAAFADATAREDRCLIGVGDRAILWFKGKASPIPPSAVISPYFVTTVWDASQGGAVARMPLKEKFAYAAFYDDVRNLQTLVERERTLDVEAAHFFGLNPLTPDEKRKVIGTMTSTQSILNAKIANARRIVEQAAALGEHAPPLPDWQKAMIVKECASASLTPPDFAKPISPPGFGATEADIRKGD